MTEAEQRTSRPSVGERIADLGFAVGWSVSQHIPERLATFAAHRGARRLWKRQGPGVRQLRANLARVLGPVTADQLDAVTEDALDRYLRYWQEAFALPTWSPERATGTFNVVEGLDRLDAAMSQGKGAVLALPHMGNWDHAGAWATARYGGLSTVAERLKPESLYDRFVEYRESLGMEVLPLGAPDVLRQLARRLNEGRLVCLLADRDLQHRGAPVTFFGEAASMPTGPAVLATLTGAPLFPVSTWHDEGATQACVYEAIEAPGTSVDTNSRGDDVPLMTQELATVFENAISAHPADWHMMQRLWHADLDRRNSL